MDLVIFNKRPLLYGELRYNPEVIRRLDRAEVSKHVYGRFCVKRTAAFIGVQKINAFPEIKTRFCTYSNPLLNGFLF